MSNQSRAVVIGAGIIGLTTALELAIRGANVVVLDQVGPGTGASGAANGALTPHSDHSVPQTVSSWALESARRYPDHVRKLTALTGLRIDHDPGGVVEVFLNTDELEVGRRLFDSMKSHGWKVFWLTRAEVLSIEPAVNRRVVGGLLYCEESAIDVNQLMSATIRAGEILGVTGSWPVAVQGVAPTDSGMVNITTNVGTMECDAVVIASGSGPCAVHGMPTIRIRRIRGEILEASGPPGLIRHCLYRGDGFITPRRDGRLLLGTSYEEHYAGMDEDTSTVSIGGAIQTLVATTEVLPALRRCELRRSWKSWRPASPDGLPIVGSYGAPNIVLALGFGGLGFTLALTAAEAAATIALSGNVAPQLGEFSPLRPGIAHSNEIRR